MQFRPAPHTVGFADAGKQSGCGYKRGGDEEQGVDDLVGTAFRCPQRTRDRWQGGGHRCTM